MHFFHHYSCKFLESPRIALPQMKVALRYTRRLLLVICHRVLACGAACCGMPTTGVDAGYSVESFKTDYRRADTWQARREACMKAIDCGLIKQGAVFKPVLDAISQSSIPTLLSHETNGDITVVIPFQARLTSSKEPSAATTFVGWYLAIDVSHNGRVRSYMLTNVHERPESIKAK